MLPVLLLSASVKASTFLIGIVDPAFVFVDDLLDLHQDGIGAGEDLPCAGHQILEGGGAGGQLRDAGLIEEVRQGSCCHP